MPVPATWEARELPVLRAIVELCEEGGFGSCVMTEHLVERTGFSSADIERSLTALADSGENYFDMHVTGGPTFMITKPTANARRAIGYWPTPEALADRFVAAVDRMAEDVEDIEQRSKLKGLATWLSSAGRQLLVDIAAETLKRSVYRS